MKVIIKSPSEKYGHEAEIPNTLEALQEAVGGYIETVTMPDFVVICNEYGRILCLDQNCLINGVVFVGPIVIAGVDGENFTDCPLDIIQWRERFSYKIDWRR